MASWQENNRRGEGVRVNLSEKASGLGVEESVGASRRTEQRRGDHRRGGGRNGGWVTVVVDILLILLVVGVAVGGYFTYRAIKNAYQPTYETRKIEFEIALVDVDQRSCRSVCRETISGIRTGRTVPALVALTRSV